MMGTSEKLLCPFKFKNPIRIYEINLRIGRYILEHVNEQ